MISLDTIKPHQILIIAFFLRGRNGELNSILVFAKFIANFKNLEDRPLAANPVDWRLCCVKQNEVRHFDLVALMQFVYRDFQLRGLNSRHKDGGTPSM